MSQKVRRRERRRRQNEEPKPVWIALGLDIIKYKLLLLGLARNQANSLRQQDRRPEVGYTRSFEFFSTKGETYYQWFRDCGIPPMEARRLVGEVGRVVGEVADATAVEKGWIPSPKGK